MVNLQSPLIGLQYEPDTGIYIGHLERQLAGYALREAKFRALLEMLTGEAWDDVELDIDTAGPQLMQIAEDALVQHTGMDRTKARTLVVQRWDKTNKSQEDVSANIRVPTAVPIDSEAALADKPAVFDGKTALENYKARKIQVVE